MAFYLCDLVGSGGEDDPCRPAIDGLVAAWSGFDCRIDARRSGGVMLVEAFPDAAEAAAIAGEARVAAVDEASARALIAGLGGALGGTA